MCLQREHESSLCLFESTDFNKQALFKKSPNNMQGKQPPFFVFGISQNITRPLASV